jgi:hypothetical protein
MNTKQIAIAILIALGSVTALAKIPPAPPVDPAVAAAKAEKDKAVAEKGKALQVAAEERAVKNFQGNMKKAGKPIPKPTPIAVAAAAPATATAPPPAKARSTKK